MRTPGADQRHAYTAGIGDVAVVIPCHNYGRYLAEAIESALNQTLPPREVIVVDDGSADNSAEVAGRFPVRLIRHEQPRGAAAARNIGWRAASTPLIAFLDADDVWLPAKLAQQVRALAGMPAAGLVYCDLYRVDGPSGRTIDRWSRHMPPHRGWVWRQELERNFVQTSAVLVRRTILHEVGGFDESFGVWEDIDLWVRIARRYQFAYVAEPLVRYRMHGHGLSNHTIPMAQGRLRATRRALETDPVRERTWACRLLASCYGDMGVALYLAGDLKDSRRWLLRALQTDLASVRERHLLPTLVKGLFGRRALAYLRTRRRRVRKPRFDRSP